MADNKKKTGKADRSKVAGGEGYEVNYFATKHRISASDARDLILRFGNSRAKLNAAAEKIAGSRGTRGGKKSRKTSKKKAKR